MAERREWSGFRGVRPPAEMSSCHAPKKRMAHATLRPPDPSMEVDAAPRDPVLLAEVERLYQQLQIEGRKGGVRSGSWRQARSPAYLALEDQIREVAGRYWKSPVRG